MKGKIILPILLIPLAIGCTDESTQQPQRPLAIQGAGITHFLSSLPSRASESTIPIGSTLTLYSQGGIQAEALELSYNGSTWEGDFQPKWETTPQKAKVTAFCPPLYRNQSDFYSNGKLCDQLMAQKEYAYQDRIILSFRHLFAQIHFTTSPKLNQRLNQIEFIPSVSVAGISPESGTITYQPTATPLCMEQNKEGDYTFLLPPTTLSIRIRIHTSSGTTHESILEAYPFQAGYTYTCPLKLSDEGLGISTVEDFIAFTHLINGESYGNRSLEEFGERTGETMTYYLNEDLTFTEEESAQVQMIGEYSSSVSAEERPFSEVFDGQGHKLSNLRFEKPVDGFIYSGLFSGIAATGVVRNLTLDQAVYNNPDDTDRAAFLAGINKGRIDNCRLQDCTIENIDKNSDFGSIASRNEGVIINCHVDNVYLKKETSYGNGIARYNTNGKIMNCAVTNCNFKKARNRGGLICNKTQNGEIQNCYLKGNTGNYYAISLQATAPNVIRCCFYPQTDTKAPVGNNYVSAPSDSLMKYGSLQPITEEILPHILNQWVLDSGTKLFPELSFSLWKQGETLPAVLVSP